jgi:hypothetical protein
VAAAHERLSAGGLRGRIVLQPSELLSDRLREAGRQPQPALG